MPATFNKKTKSWDNLSRTGGGSGFTASSELRGKPTKFDKQVRKNKKAQSVKIAGRDNYTSVGPTSPAATINRGKTAGVQQEFGQGSFGGGAGGSFNPAATSPVKLTQEDINNIVSNRDFNTQSDVYDQIIAGNYQIVADDDPERLAQKTPSIVLDPSMGSVTAANKLVSGGFNRLTQLVGTKNKLGVRFTINAKTIKNTKKVLKKYFKKNTLAIIGAWAGAVYLGKWGQAESTEPLGITMRKYLIPDARKTGNWTLVEEAQTARDELLDLPWWKEAVLWSPLSPTVGVVNKIKGAIYAVNIQDKVIEDMRIQDETGETDDEKWARVRQEEIDRDKASVDYYNEQKKLMVEWEREAQRNARNEDAAFWANERQKQLILEEKERKKIADFWNDYRKEVQKMQEDSRPSSLGFGLL